MLKSILLELVRKNSALSQIIYKYEIQNVAYPRELNWNMHLYTKLTFSSRPEWEKNWNRIRKQETGDFFSRWCLNLFVIFIKKTYHIKIKKTNKQNKETDILENKKRGTEKDRHVHAIKNCLTICEEFVHGYSFYESCLGFRPLAIDVIECHSSFFCFLVIFSN